MENNSYTEEGVVGTLPSHLQDGRGRWAKLYDAVSTLEKGKYLKLKFKDQNTISNFRSAAQSHFMRRGVYKFHSRCEKLTMYCWLDKIEA